MRPVLSAILVHLLLLLPPHPASSAAFESVVLENGLTVIAAPDHSAPVVTICIAVKTGAVCQTPETCGLAHFYEHMFFKGNALLPDQTAYGRRSNELGIVRNGTTSDEVVKYYVTLPSDRLAEGLEFMYYAIATPLFDESEMEIERQVILNEYQRNTTSPFWDLWKAYEDVLHPSAPWRADAIGTPEVILSADREVMDHFRRTYYTPDNCALIIAGDVQAGQAFAAAAGAMSDWTFGGLSDYDRLPPSIDIRRDTTVVIRSSPGVRHISVVFEGPPILVDPGATYAADVWGTFMEMTGGEFYRDMVTEGPFLSISAGYHTQRFSPTVTFSGTPAPGRTREALEALESEILELTEPSYYESGMLSSAADILRRRRLMSEETSFDVATGSLAFWWVVAGSLDYYEPYLDSLAAVTPADVQAFVSRYIDGRPSVTFVMDPGEEGS